MILRPTTRDAYRFFMKGTEVLARVERNGIRIDTAYLKRTITETDDNVATLVKGLRTTKVWKAWVKRFRNPNLNSVQQLGTVLSSMGYSTNEQTPTGLPKWDERALESVKDPFVKDYLLLKKLKKVRDTYLRGIERETDMRGFLHPSYNLAGGLDDEEKGGAMSYRGSSSDPNFQNIPIRNKMMGGLIRKAFIARNGYLLGEVDFSTIEVRIAASVTKDRRLIQYVSDKTKDMHRDRACELFFLKPDQVDNKTTRDASKNKFVFPQFYGSYYLDCAKAIWENMVRGEWKIPGTDTLVRDHLRSKGIRKLGLCSEDRPPKPGTFEYHVKTVEDHMWNEVFVEYTAWKRRWYNKYLDTCEVPMPTGFVAKGMYRKNQVLNLPIQGPAFHCLLWSVIEIQREIDKRGLRTKIVGQIHDCVLLDIHEDEVQEVLDLCHDVMTVRLPKAWPWIIVPLEIEADLVPKGLSWADKEPWVRNDMSMWASKS